MTVFNRHSFWVRTRRHFIIRLRRFYSDKKYLEKIFPLLVGYPLDLDNPKTYNEKLQWLKLYDRREIYTTMVDKVEAKKYVASIIGEQYIIPTFGVWNRVEDIDWDNLPQQFVVKSSNDCGGIVVCKDKNQLEKTAAINKLRERGRRNYSKLNVEYPYENVPHRFLAEQYMEDESGIELKDYKFFCFDGIPQFLFVATGRQKGDTRFDFFDTNFNHLPVTNGHPCADITPKKPKNFEKMLEIASELSKGFPHIRVDLYNINGKIYFGELTLFHWSGLMPFDPSEWDIKFGNYFKLPNK